MGHMIGNERTYSMLQRRLDMELTGAPESPILLSILKLLFSPEEAELARNLPMRPRPLEEIAKKLDLERDKLREKVDDMARKGLVFDMEIGGRQYVILAPIVIGFFEFTFMRSGEDLPLGELARLFDIYMGQNDRFARSVFEGETQIGRTLVREEALPPEEHSEILDWERASEILKSASTIGVSLCACRHKAEHQGRACDAPQRTCLSLNTGAEVLISQGIAERIDIDEGMEILQQCKEAGLAQTADNVRENVSYLCNCCSCCCEMFRAMKTWDLGRTIVSSNWIASINGESCLGCGLCEKACPAGAISTVKEEGGSRRAVIDPELCLGCGICATACKSGSILMSSRPSRVFTPQDTFERILAMAIERGKLSNFIFDDPSRLSHRTLGRIAAAIEKSPPVKAMMAAAPLRSAFLERLVKMARGGL